MASLKKCINVRFEDEMYDDITKIAEHFKCSRSEIVRDGLKDVLNRPYEQYTKEQFDKRVELIKALTIYMGGVERKLIGATNNLNQIAKKVNSGTTGASQDSLDYIRDEMAKCVDCLCAIHDWLYEKEV